LFQEPFGRNKRHYIGVIKAVDLLRGEIAVAGGNVYGLDGRQKDSLNRGQLVELTEEIRREVFRREAQSTLKRAIGDGWDQMPDETIRQILALLPPPSTH
jgi:hypothetical protein